MVARARIRSVSPVSVFVRAVIHALWYLPISRLEALVHALQSFSCVTFIHALQSLMHDILSCVALIHELHPYIYSLHSFMRYTQLCVALIQYWPRKLETPP